MNKSNILNIFRRPLKALDMQSRFCQSDENMKASASECLWSVKCKARDYWEPDCVGETRAERGDQEMVKKNKPKTNFDFEKTTGKRRDIKHNVMSEQWVTLPLSREHWTYAGSRDCEQTDGPGTATGRWRVAETRGWRGSIVKYLCFLSWETHHHTQVTSCEWPFEWFRHCTGVKSRNSPIYIIHKHKQCYTRWSC